MIDASALTLLNNLLVSGSSYPTPLEVAFAPPPGHIALASTLLVHPLHTTRATTSDLFEVSSKSLIFLRNILLILGPINGDLGEAYSFKSSQSRGGRQSRRLDRDSSEDSGSDDESLGCVLANENSLWTKAQDFWHVVGWAFNCSVKYPARWKFWKLWLEHMLAVLDADWKERSRLDSLQKDNDSSMLKQCMLLKYVCGNSTRSHAVKRVVKAIFTDGSTEALRAYPEVFQNETKEFKAQGGVKRKRGMHVDVDKEQYGDYIQDEDIEAADDTLTSSQPTPPLSDEEERENGRPRIATSTMGGSEAIALRLRLLALLSQVCAVFPEYFITVQDLYNLFYDCIRPLPLPTFSFFFSGSAYLHLPNAVMSSLAQVHIYRLLPHATLKNDDLDQEILERHILPFAANTSSIEDNAKVALLAETLLRLFAVTCELIPNKAIEKSLEKGIQKREDRIVGDRRKKLAGPRNKEEERDRASMRASGVRMRALLRVLKERR